MVVYTIWGAGREGSGGGRPTGKYILDTCADLKRRFINCLGVKFKFQTLSHLSSALVNTCVEIFFGIEISENRQKHLEATQIH